MPYEQATESLRTRALTLIEDHFPPRQPPSTITDSLQLTDVEYDEVTHFEGMDWRDIEFWQAEFRRLLPLIEQIIAQTERRVLAGEKVPADEKLVSLFEPHADIIVKGSREIEYGHKLNLTTGRSGLILHLSLTSAEDAKQQGPPRET